MLTTLKKMFDVERLNKELKEKDEEIARLKERLNNRPVDSFRAVATPFDATKLFDTILDETTEEFKRVIDIELLSVLKTAASLFKQDEYRMRGLVAEVDHNSAIREFEIELKMEVRAMRLRVASMY